MALTLGRPFRGEPWSTLSDPVARLNGLILYPLHLRNARQYLLLGDDDNTKMRVLFVPEGGRSPEIIPLSITFAEALTRLTAEWDKLMEVRRDRKAASVDGQIEAAVEV